MAAIAEFEFFDQSGGDPVQPGLGAGEAHFMEGVPGRVDQKGGQHFSAFAEPRKRVQSKNGKFNAKHWADWN